MYNRSYRQRRPPTVPINYSGNAFSRPLSEKGNFDVMPIPAPPSIVEAVPIEIKEEEKCDEACEVSHEKPCEASRATDETRECDKCEEKGKPNFLSGLFGGKLFPRGIGNEELLLLALILLVAQSDEPDELLIYLVVLLLS